MLGWRDRRVGGAALLLSVGLVGGCGSMSGSTGGSGPTGTATPITAPAAPAHPTPAPTRSGPQPCPPTVTDAEAAVTPRPPTVAAPSSLGLPLGAQAVQVCAYGPIGLSAGDKLSWSRDLGSAATGALLAVVDARVRKQTDLLGRVNCPADNGAAALLRFSYGDGTVPPTEGQTQDVLVHLTGCRSAVTVARTTMSRPDIGAAILALHRPES